MNVRMHSYELRKGFEGIGEADFIGERVLCQKEEIS